MAIWKTPIDLKTINERSKDTLAEHLSIIFTEVGDDYLIATMPVNAHTQQPLGIMHGGASCVLAETVASTAANFCIDINTHYCVGLAINTNHIRSARTGQGQVIGTAKPYHLGRSTQVWSIEIHNDNRELVSVNRLTMAVLSRGGGAKS